MELLSTFPCFSPNLFIWTTAHIYSLLKIAISSKIDLTWKQHKYEEQRRRMTLGCNSALNEFLLSPAEQVFGGGQFPMAVNIPYELCPGVRCMVNLEIDQKPCFVCSMFCNVLPMFYTKNHFRCVVSCVQVPRTQTTTLPSHIHCLPLA